MNVRQIKFRGVNHETDELVYGWYTRLVSGARKYDAIIADTDGTLVEFYIHSNKTIGQFTGLTDKNGVDIYDGDIVKSYHYTSSGVDYFINHTIAWSDKFNGWFALNNGSMSEGDGSLQLWVYMKASHYTAEVIGNIHQNSELLEK